MVRPGVHVYRLADVHSRVAVCRGSLRAAGTESVANAGSGSMAGSGRRVGRDVRRYGALIGYWAAKGFFFYENVMTAVGLTTSRRNPWVEAKWYLRPAWLFFPALVRVWLFCTCRRFGSRRLRCQTRAAGAPDLWFLLDIVSPPMVAMTLRGELALLAFDCRTSILMPAVFLTAGD